jgi:RimJ/RimL family protein N-acetyltransferase
MIETGRLTLRAWRDNDVPSYRAMGSDLAFMRYLGPAMSLADAQAAAARQNAYLESFGACFWAIEHRTSGAFIGYCGIKPGPAGTPIAGLPEIGWGIAPDHQRRGYAREAAAACVDWAWTGTNWPSVFAMTVPANEGSWGLMDKLGIDRLDGADFDHPALAVGHSLRRHILYRIDRPAL